MNKYDSFHAPCPMPHAPCPMPHAPVRMFIFLYVLCPYTQYQSNIF
ncbi:hypothetical protein H6G81_28140 [Scytonema hofmannii FACHB-248]|uniref:Histidine kinase n=1 Tax=Scytonema hofmannii FACHB-248 TaxID=1842502 RepID=A0ABR8GZ41_9CYAN|nr:MULTISPECIES: hypothetical protein [Nostocales]MBD2608281.1 hypothetical protein [Scytonema hofmannii FACHB-248]